MFASASLKSGSLGSTNSGLPVLLALAVDMPVTGVTDIPSRRRGLSLGAFANGFEDDDLDDDTDDDFADDDFGDDDFEEDDYEEEEEDLEEDYDDFDEDEADYQL